MIKGSVGKDGKNRQEDVLAVQRMLNANIWRLVPLSPLSLDGEIGPMTIRAIETFQQRVLSIPRPDGRVDPGGATLRQLQETLKVQPSEATSGPKWLEIARKEIGQKEVAGLANSNARVLEYIGSFPYLADIPHTVKKAGKDVPTGFMLADVDATPWCACFVNWCLAKAGKGTKGMNARAQTWMEYGTPLPSAGPRVGAVAVIYKPPVKKIRSTTSSGFHVAFYAGGPPHAPVLVGGNQGDKVSEVSFAGWSVQAYRWPQ